MINQVAGNGEISQRAKKKKKKKPLRSAQEETENLNHSVFIKGIDFIIINVPTKKTLPCRVLSAV